MAREVGFVVTASGAGAKKVLVGLGKAAVTSGAMIKTAGSMSATAFKAAGTAVVVFNQGLDLARRTSEFLQRTFDLVVQKSLKFRGLSDPVVKAFKDMERSSEVLAASIGDILIPILIGLKGNVGDLNKGIVGWVRSNRRVIATGIVEWARDLSLVIVDGIAKGIILAAESWQTFNAAVGFVQELVNEFFDFVLDNIKPVIEAIAGMASIVGVSTENVNKLISTADDLGLLSDEFEKSAAKAAEIVVVTEAQAESLKAFAISTRDAVLKPIEEISKRALKAIRTTRLSSIKTREEQLQDLEKVNQAIEASSRRRINAIEMQSKLQEDLARSADAAMQKSKETALEVATAISTSFGEAVGGIIAGTMDIREAFGSMLKTVINSVIQIATKMIIANAATAATGAASSQAGIPVVGPALAVTAAAAMSAFALGFLNRFQAGGEVVGGIQGRDSVPALLAPGERVLTVDENSELKRLVRRISQPRPGPGKGLLSFQAGGEVPSRAPSGTASMQPNVNLSVNLNTLDLPSEEQQRRVVLNLAGQMEQLIADGVILRGLAT